MRRINTSSDRAARGFTLIEMIISLVLMGIVAMVMIPLLQMPMNGYLNAQRRTELQSQLSLVRSKLGDDLANALPGSVRIRQVGAVRYLEFLEVKAVGRYRSLQTNPLTTDYCTTAADATCSRDAFNPSCAETCFTSLGPLYTTGAAPAVGDYVSVLPQFGSATPSAYSTAANSPTSRVTAAGALPNGEWGLRFTAHQFQDDDLQKRFYLIRQPVSYVCRPAAGGTTGTLVKRWGYPMNANQPIAFGAANSATLATRVNTCVFNLATAATAPQNLRQTLSLQLTLATISGAAITEQTQAQMQFVVREP